MKRPTRFLTILIVIITMFLTNCRKDVTLPNPEFKKLFGQWEWVVTYDSLTGNSTTPVTYGHNITLEFNENGIYKRFEDGKRKEKRKFTFSEGASLTNGKKEMWVKITDHEIFWKKDYLSDRLIEFIGQDSLYIFDTYYEGFCFKYIKK